MNHDYAHCADWKKDCPKTCFRAQLTAELLKECFFRPVSFMHLEGTEECERERYYDSNKMHSHEEDA